MASGGDSLNLFHAIVRLLYVLTPDWFIIEDVDDIEEGGEDDIALDQMLGLLQNAGYGTQPYTLTAHDYV